MRVLRPKPLGIVKGSVEMMAGFVEFMRTSLCGLGSPGQQSRDLRLAQGPEIAGGRQRMLKNGERVASSNDHTGREAHCIVEAFQWIDRLALQNERIAQRLHPQYADVFRQQYREHFFLETIIMRIHEIERHLYGIEDEVMTEGGLEHPQVKGGAFMAGKSDVTNLSCLPRCASS